MTLDAHTMAQLHIAMRDHKRLSLEIGNVVVLVDRGGGPWKQDMICGAVVTTPHSMARKWCRTLQEMEEFLEGFG